MLTRRLGSTDDSGFSLVELLLVIVILGVIAMPLSNVIIAALRNTDQSAGKLAESHDAQLSSAYWAADVASIGTRSTVDPLDPRPQPSIETDVDYNAGRFPCGAAGTPKAVVRFAWDEASPTATTLVVVAYVVRPAGARFELYRLRCNGSTVAASEVVLAHDLVGAPAVLCAGGGGCAGIPSSVHMRLTIQDSKSREPSYVITLDGNRRQE